jgi:hypothetical protein
VLDASCVQLAEDADEPGRMRATLPNGRTCSLAADLGAAEGDQAGNEVVVQPVREGSALASALVQEGEPAVGALVDAGMVGRHALLLPGAARGGRRSPWTTSS